jgi:general stress protein YciG
MDNTPEEKRGMTVAEAGRRGGNKVKVKYGSEFYQTIGRLGGIATKKKHGPEFYTEIGKRGGATVKKLVNASQQVLDTKA